MPVFGGYETVRELFRTGLASAYTARKAGSTGPARYVVKVLQPAGLVGQEQAGGELVERFVDAARTQQKVAASGAGHWAAVHEIARDEQGGAWFVSDHHGRSAEQLIAGRVKLSGGGLYRIIRGVVAGLLELKRAAGRAHGNLKPTNVLLSGRGDVSGARVLLTDPAPSTGLDPAAAVAADYRAIGELIYRLVLHRTGRAMGALRAVEGKEWDRLGRNGDGWRLLCNRLLSPNFVAELTSLEDLAEDVEKLRERAGPGPVKLLVAGGILAAAVAAVLVGPSAYRLLTGGPAVVEDGSFGPAERQRWERLCLSWRWLRPLLVQYGRQGGRMVGWEKDEHLRGEVLGRLAAISRDSSAYNPRWFAGMARFPYAEDCAERPSRAAQSAEGIHKTRAALEAIDALRAALEAERWPACSALREAAGRFRRRKWAEPVAAYLENLVEFDPNDAVGRVEAVLAAGRLVGRLEAEWEALERLRAKLAGWGEGQVRPLAEIGRYIEAEAGSIEGISGENPPARLLVKLRDLHADGSLLRNLEAMLAERTRPGARPLDWAYVKSHPPFAEMTAPALRAGMQALRDGRYDVLADPLAEPRWRAEVDAFLTKDMPAAVAALEKLIASQKSGQMMAAIGDADARGGFVRRLDEAGAEVGKLRAELGALGALVKQAVARECTRETIAQKNRDKADILARRGAMERAVEAVRQAVSAVQVDMEKFLRNSWEGYVRALKSRDAVSRPRGRERLTPVDAAWVRQRDALIAAAEPKRQVAELSRQIAALEGFLRRLEGAFDANLPAGLAEAPGTWREGLARRALARQRSDRVQGVLSYVDFGKVVSGRIDTDEQFRQALDAQLGVYGKWRSGLAMLLTDFDRVAALLAGGYGLAEKPGQSGESIAGLVGRNSGNPAWADADANEAIRPFHARVVRLRRVASMSPAELLAEIGRARQGQFESARAAYLRLGRTGWPASRADLTREVELRKGLATVYSELPAERRAALLAELAAESRRRWVAFAARATAAADIEDCLARMERDFGIDANDGSLPELVRYRRAMRDLRARVQARPGRLSDEAVKQAVREFLARIAPLAGIRRDAQLAGILKELSGVPSAAGGGGVDLTRAGPGSAPGWRIVSRTGEEVSYASGQARLTFRKVAPAGGTPCFLSVTEVSVGLFRRLTSARWKEMDGLLPLEEDAVGPRCWVRGEGALAVAENWLHDVHPTLAGRVYPDGRQPPDPNERSPMQHVSLAGAILACRLLNCRLPTAAEWSAAASAGRGAGAANLRDATWLAQRDYLARLVETDQVQATLYWPDAGIFVPRGLNVATGRSAPAAGSGDDGVLWFAPVDSGSGAFRHVVGNVAEFTYERPGVLERLSGGRGAAAAEVAALVRSAARDAARVVGGSALSPPKVAVSSPQPLPDPAGGEALRQSFSDVGFRMAFTAGRERLQDQVLRLLGTLRNDGYLSASR